MAAIPVTAFARKERGALLIVVLFILLVTTILGLSAMDATGLEMQMSSNSREQLLMHEAAEYAITQVAQQITALDGFTDNSLANKDCGNLCFDENCTGGYCFFGLGSGDPSSWKSCATGLPAAEPSQTQSIWVNDSGRHKTLAIPHAQVTVKYLIEFRCYAAIDDSLAMDDANNSKVFRITTLVKSSSGRSGVMLRVAIKNL
jgi:Tfp pilus assembly protein PilX